MLEPKKISLLNFIFKQPEGQKLAAAAISVVMFLTSVISVIIHSYYATLQKDIIKCETKYTIAENTIDSLKNAALKKSEDDNKKNEDINKKLQATILWQDSIKQSLQILLYNKK